MDYRIKIEELELMIEQLPEGYVTRKRINGRLYYYHQWKEDGKTRNHIIKEAEAKELSERIELRKELQKQLRQLKQKESIVSARKRPHRMEFSANVICGEDLLDMAKMAEGWERRDCFPILRDYLYSSTVDRVCLVYGLRRTGKTTLIRQLILDMSREDLMRTAYIKVTQLDAMSTLNQDLKKLREAGYHYLFIDEITLLNDFIDSAALFSDVYAAQGMKILLSGTDSLGFYFAMNEELYDRAVMVHTTFVPYREHARLLKMECIDEYIRYGGTLKAGELAFDEDDVNAADASFRDDESTRRYIDTAICKNIQHSLSCYSDGSFFRHLKQLYEADELTNAINRIIQNLNHDFTVRVITEDFRSRDLGSAAQLLRNARKEEERTEALDLMDKTWVVERLMRILDIVNRDNQQIGILPAHAYEIREYLKALDLIEIVQAETFVPDTEPIEHVIFTQPGMRFCQAQALIYALMKDKGFLQLSEREKRLITDKILDDVRGIMMEDIVLLETSKSLPGFKRAFKLMFDAAEYDMVIYNEDRDECEIYEIKHSAVPSPGQYKHLMREELLEKTEKRYGRIVKRCVLYTGEPKQLDNGIVYENVERYLKTLG